MQEILTGSGALELKTFRLSQPQELDKGIARDLIGSYQGTIEDGQTIEVYSAADSFYIQDETGKLFKAEVNKDQEVPN